jgi:hypothetical protein
MMKDLREARLIVTATPVESHPSLSITIQV